MSDESGLTKGQKASFTKQLREYKEETQKSLSEIKDEIALIKKFTKDYLSDDDKSIKTKIDVLVNTIEKKSKEAAIRFDEIDDLHIKLCEGDGKEESYDTIITDFKDNVISSFSEIESKKKDIVSFAETIFGKEENGKIIKSGLTQQFDSKIKSIDDFHKNQEKKFKALFESIEGLLPGATSVGLAKAYEEQKKSYDKPLRNWSYVFVSTLIIMLFFGWYYFSEISEIKEITVSTAFISLLNKTPFFIPTIWLALYASKKQSQYKRLQQEYAFKEIFAKSYGGHKNQIEDLDYDPEDEQILMKELLANLVAITSHNPSDTLDYKSHNDNHPIMNVFERVLASSKKTFESKEIK